jgi:acyl-CoA thioester hydrolase
VNMDTHERFAVPILVRPEAIDELGHVNNVIYVRWIQDAAVAHWRALATPEEQAAWAWVVVRHEIDYRRAARLGEELVAETWVGTATSRSFDRHTEILLAPDRKVLVRARTVWCPIDPGTGKPKQVSGDARARWSVLQG